MQPPPGFDANRKLCKLRKALYGLKQSPRAWFERLRSAVLKWVSIKEMLTTPSVKWRNGQVVILIVHVDGMVVTGDNLQEITLLKENLAREFEIKDLGPLKYFLGIEVPRSQGHIHISQ